VNLFQPPIRQKTPKPGQGFSLVELLIALALLAIVLAFAVPNFRQSILNNRVKAATETLISVINMARNEAIAQNKTVILCPNQGAGNSCGTDYANGVLLLKDNAIFYRTESMPSGIKIVGENKWEFQNSGAPSPQGGEFTISGEGNISRMICIGAFGQITAPEVKDDKAGKREEKCT